MDREKEQLRKTHVKLESNPPPNGCGCKLGGRGIWARPINLVAFQVLINKIDREKEKNSSWNSRKIEPRTQNDCGAYTLAAGAVSEPDL